MTWFIIVLHSSEKFQTPWKLDVKNIKYNKNINIHVWRCVHAHSWVWVSHLCVWECAFTACIWKSEDNLGCFFPSGSFCFWFETGSLIDTGLCHIGQAIRFLHFQRSFCLCLPSLRLTLFYVGSGDWNSDPHTCKDSTLPTEISLQPIYLQFLQQNLYLDRCETLCFLNYFLQGKYLWAQLQNC